MLRATLDIIGTGTGAGTLVQKAVVRRNDLNGTGRAVAEKRGYHHAKYHGPYVPYQANGGERGTQAAAEGGRKLEARRVSRDSQTGRDCALPGLPGGNPTLGPNAQFRILVRPYSAWVSPRILFRALQSSGTISKVAVLLAGANRSAITHVSLSII